MNITNPPVIHSITQTIKSENLKHVILQLNKKHLNRAFELTKILRQHCPNTEFYTLYDSMKKECCTDIIGSRHIECYDGLFHFGYACFSQKWDQRHHYILPDSEEAEIICERLLSEETVTYVKSEDISVIAVDQCYYNAVMRMEESILSKFKEQGVPEMQIARLPFDIKGETQAYEYLGFSYWVRKQSDRKNMSILVVKPESMDEAYLPTLQADLTEQFEPTCDLLLQNLYLCKNSLQIDRIYSLSPSSAPCLYNKDQNKRLMQRISQISNLQKYTTYGILVSNPSTKFCHQQIQRCRELLERNNLKHFTFMMNNLNECKLGNFPQIEVYVLISCYNYSLYSSKDFCRYVVTPYDLEIAFGDAGYDCYNFDLGIVKGIEKGSDWNGQGEKEGDLEEGGLEEQKNESIGEDQIMKATGKEIIRADFIQTLDFYRSREYKGLDFSEKKEMKKVSKGKTGIAEKYTKLE